MWMELETLILSEISQKEKDKYHMTCEVSQNKKDGHHTISLICGV